MNRRNDVCEEKGTSILIDPKVAAQVDRLMQAGYQALLTGQDAAACRVWQAAWLQIVSLLDQHPSDDDRSGRPRLPRPGIHRELGFRL